MTVTMHLHITLPLFIALARLSGGIVVVSILYILHRHKGHSENLWVSTSSSSHCQQTLIIVSKFKLLSASSKCRKRWLLLYSKLEDGLLKRFIRHQIWVVFRDCFCKLSSVNKSNVFLNDLRILISYKGWPILTGRHKRNHWECIETGKVSKKCVLPGGRPVYLVWQAWDIHWECVETEMVRIKHALPSTVTRPSRYQVPGYWYTIIHTYRYTGTPTTWRYCYTGYPD